MGPANCAVIGCANNTRKLQKWKETICEEHVGQEKGKCACQRLIVIGEIFAKLVIHLSRIKNGSAKYASRSSWKKNFE